MCIFFTIDKKKLLDPVLKYKDYYPGGLPQPGRSYNSGSYRYGHNTQESDPEISGTWGTHYTAEFWMYDARINRRWNVDPVVYLWQSGYSVFNNNPIYYIDPSGREGEGTSDPIVYKKGEVPRVSLDEVVITPKEKPTWLGSLFNNIKNWWSSADFDNSGNYVNEQNSGLNIQAEFGGNFNKTIATEDPDIKSIDMTEFFLLRPNVGVPRPTGVDAVQHLIQSFTGLLQTVSDLDVKNNIEKQADNTHKVYYTRETTTAYGNCSKTEYRTDSVIYKCCY